MLQIDENVEPKVEWKDTELTRSLPPKIEIFVGEPVQYSSERSVIEKLVCQLEAESRCAVIFANISLSSRQIDFVVAVENKILVIEAKGYTHAIRGGENGPWQIKAASGDWKDFRNPYAQARDAALAVRDAMRSFARIRTEVPYPAAAVIFTPNIPYGSEIYQGDFKVSVTGLDGLHDALQAQQPQTRSWPLDRWKTFAQHLRLTPVSTVAAACDPALFEAEDLLRQYVAAYRCAYTHPEPFVPFGCRSGDEMVSSDDLVRLVTERHADILIQGPSGCGKSLLADQAGLRFAEHGGLAITIPVKDYTGSLKAVLDREVGLLSGAAATRVLGAARRLNRPLLLVVDGYNECAVPERPSLTRALAALVRKCEASLLVSSQCPVSRSDLLALRTVEVPPATPETKTAIALSVAGGDALTNELENLLGAVATGLEAKLIGEVGQQLGRGESRYALFDAFARKRLDEAASDGIRLLSRLAGWLSERIAFSLSVRDLDRLMDQDRVPHSIATRLQTAMLLTQRRDRISFAHEMFFDAFASENVIRCAAGQPAPVLTALMTPQHTHRRAFIIGAIDDHLLRDQVLEGLADAQSIAACLTGACGRAAREWAEARCVALWDRLRAEALGLRFRISDRGWGNVAFDEATLTAWTPLERAFLDAMPQQIVEGYYLDKTLRTVGILDQRIAEEGTRLRDEARERKVALRSALFANAYVFQSSTAPGIAHICTHLHGGLFRTTSDALARMIERKLGEDSLSPGQVYLLLMLSRGGDIAAPLIAQAIKSHWAGAPYHLQLDLVAAAHCCRPSNDRDRVALIAAIEALPQPGYVLLSTTIVEALQCLGALENSEHEHIAVVREEVNQCLTDPRDPEHCGMAYGLYSAQFDHPYAGAYCAVIAELPENDQKTLLTMAANGATDTSFFLAPLLIDLASSGDPAVGNSIARWTALPRTDSVMPQDCVAVFVVAHIALARLGCTLPELDGRCVGAGHSAEALAACGAILYWCNRAELNETTRRRACDAPLRVLIQHERGVALDVIQRCERATLDGVTRLSGEPLVERSILSGFPAEAAEICRQALARPLSQVGYFRHYSNYDRLQNLTLALDVLAHHGNRVDLSLLRQYATDPTLGTSAIEAVKMIEKRLAPV